MSDTNVVAGDHLRSFVERLERLSEEKKRITEDEKDVMAEAKGNGFDPKIIRKILALRKKDPNERSEEQALLDTYLKALGMQPEFDFDGDE